MVLGPLRRWLVFAILVTLLGLPQTLANEEKDGPGRQTVSPDELTRIKVECAERVEELRGKVESMEQLKLDLGNENKEKDEGIKVLKVKLEEAMSSLASCERGAAILEKDFQKLELQLDKERSTRFGSAQQLENALSELEGLREAWLPFWFVQRVEEARVVAAPKVRQLAGAIKKHSSHAAAFWRQQASPRVKQVKRQGWAGVQGLSAAAFSKANEAYGKVPSKYRKHIDASVSGVRRAWPPVKRALIMGHAHVIQAVDEIALLVEKSPWAPSLAKEASHVVALLVISLPLTLAIPAMARTSKKKTRR